MDQDPLQTIPAYLRLSDRIATGGQPAAEQFEMISNAGVKIVVNLALAASPEAVPDEAERVRRSGMEYVHIPVEWQSPLQEQLAEFFSLMDRRREQCVFVHCAANKRVSVFLYLYRRMRLGVAEEEALAALRQIWEPNPVWQAFIQQALERPELNVRTAGLRLMETL